MRITVAFPNVGAAQDRIALRDYAQALEGLGVDTIHVVDHVVYAWPAADGTRRSQYRADLWHLEAFTTLGFLAAVTERCMLETGVLVLPQRPPALVAKEAATVDVLSNGRLRLGVGVGWQEPEYSAMGVPFKERGARMEEAIAVLKEAWMEPHINHMGRYYHFEDVGMEPKPLQKPHPPIIIGGGSPAVLERAGRIGNGWVAGPGVPPAAFDQSRRAVIEAARAAGREDEVTIFEGSIFPQSPDPADNVEALRAHVNLGATDVLYWMGTARDPALRPLEGKLEYLTRLMKEVWPEFR
ncbi:MAG TPA: TIGR03619 family F420-dependent LLM class oxidoreductase [Dehalococcoidia bacterium]